MTTRDRLHALLTNHLPTARDTELTGTVWLQDLGLDSIAMMGLVVEVEDHFDVVLDQRTLLDLRSIDDLVTWLDQHPGARR